MRKFCTYLFGGVFVLCLTACQSAPKEDIVVNKNEGVLESAIQESVDALEVEANTPQMYTDTFDTASATVKGEINAKINYPTEAIPVLRVKPRDITVDEVKQWAEVLFEGNTAYEPKNVKTKSEIEEQILRYREAMSDKEKFYAEKGDAWDLYEAMIANLEKEYETAPETYTRKETDWTFHDWYYYHDDGLDQEITNDNLIDLSKNFELVIETEKGALNGYQGYISASNRNEDDFTYHSMSFSYTDSIKMLDELQKTGQTRDEAFSMANEVKEKLGFGDWKLYAENIDDRSERYSFSYAPVYNNVVAHSGRGGNDVTGEDMYAANYSYEHFEIYIVCGQIWSIEWDSPLEIISEENSNVKVLSVEQVIDSFKNHVKSEYTDTYIDLRSVPLSGGKLVVDNISCKLMRVKVKNTNNEYYMLPVWTFDKKIEDDYGATYTYNIATINGLDGSVVNVDLGY